MHVTILGGGPAGLYCALLLKKTDAARNVTVIERNAPDATYGWGVVFSDRTLASFQEADHTTYRAIRDAFVQWDAIDVYFHGQRIRCGGHVFAGLARKRLLAILQQRCAELGVSLRYNTDISDPTQLLSLPLDGTQPTVPSNRSGEGPRENDALLIAADGVNSLTRAAHADVFRPSLVPGHAKYIWFGTDKLLDAFTFIFRENEHGLFQVHAYPFDGTTSTFIVECAEDTWRKSKLDTASEAESIAYCERLFAQELNGARIYSNNSRWISFVTVKTATWRHGNIVLLGDAAHTAHFSIGSGTKLAMEDAIALANALDAHADFGAALREYESVRRPVVETLQEAARESQTYFESVSRYAGLAPVEFTFNLLTRSGRITYDDLRLRDARFGEAVDWHYAASVTSACGEEPPRLTPSPMFTPRRLRGRVVSNRAVVAEAPASLVDDGTPDAEATLGQYVTCGIAGAGLVLAEHIAVSAEGRRTPGDVGLYMSLHGDAWAGIVEAVHAAPGVGVGMVLNHAGRRGAVRPASEARGLDRPLREGEWPLVAASPIPYTPRSQTPHPLDRFGMERVRDDFARSARMADEAGCDLLMLHMAHGYLLASFLSPLANRRNDEYGGSLENRMRFPLEVFDAVRAAWPEDKPLAVALNADDCAPGGFTVNDAITVARALRDSGCDVVQVLAGQTIPDDQPRYGRGHLTAYSDRIRNEAGICTLVGGYLTTANEVNTVLAGGRADLCILHPYMLTNATAIHRTSHRKAR